MEGKKLLLIARQALTAAVTGVQYKPDTSISEHQGAFVTLHKKGRLRGCIGYITSDNALSQTIQEAAFAAALHDPRFPAVTAEELADITLEVSILSRPQLIRSKDQQDILMSITPGRDGLIISKGFRNGLLLPQVFSADDNPEEMLAMTCEKAGLPRSAWKDENTEIRTFHATIYSEDINDQNDAALS